MAKKSQQTNFGWEDASPESTPLPMQTAETAPTPETAPTKRESPLSPPSASSEIGLPDLAGKLVIVIDSHSLIYQVFHALPPMTSPQGEPVGAIHGFLGDIIELVNRFHPDYLFCAFDKSEVTFRNQIFSEYKAHRDPMPEELRQQLPVIHDSLRAFGTTVLECGGYEADDILATLAALVDAHGGHCLIVTSDKDCRQLITDRVQLYNIRKNETFGREQLKETWGITPEQVVDFQTLVGDSVDNIPGVPLIGPKLAQELLAKHGTLEEVFAHAHELSGPKRRQNLIEGRAQALISRQLVKLRTDVPCQFLWNEATPTSANPQQIDALCERWGFRRLRERAKEVLGKSPPTESTQTSSPTWQAEYQLVRCEAELQRVVDACRNAGRFALDTETTGTHPRSSALVGISMAWAPGQAAYIPIRAPAGETVADLDLVKRVLQPLLSDPQIGKLGQNIKFDLIVLRSAGFDVHGVCFDSMVADYLLNPGQRNHSLDDLAKRYLNHETTRIDALIGSGKKQKCMDEVPLEAICQYAAEDADVPLRLYPLLKSRLEEVELWQLFEDVELPLIQVLADLEYQGIFVDVGRLKSMSDDFSSKIEQILGEIRAIAGCEMNPDSPKQLAEVLFNRLGLRIVKKTKTGASTDAEVLETLASEHPLPALILRYRQWTKLKNTYVDALPLLVDAHTRRVHTSFRQDVAATGRLSSTEPNLQNIPIRTEEGRAIRSAFKAGPTDWLLLSADYSQIELRVLAHYCEDQALLEAYQKDQDIHARVAAEVFGVNESQVTSDMRRTAKTINFGIVYGQSPFGLAKTLGIEKAAAAAYIEAYFARYPGVLDFMRRTLVQCRKQGYVQTMLGRRRYVQGLRDFSGITEAKQWILTEPERIAVNTVIQGSAADLIKIAMLKVHQRLALSSLQARMLLQIHDELLFEFDPNDRAALSELVRKEMSTAAALKVPLKVEIKVGPSWAECEV